MRAVTVTPAQIREAWTTIQAGRDPFKRKHAWDGLLTDWRRTSDDGWIGVTGPAMSSMLENGYNPDSDLNVDLSMGAAEISSPMMDWDEEHGDLMIEAALGGEDLPYLTWTDFEAKRGLTIRAMFDFNAGTKAHVLHAYFGWILRVIDAAERQGLAPQVELMVACKRSFGANGNDLIVHIPVVQAGELIDVTAWRAFFHGGGFRTLGFVAMGLAGDQTAQTLVSGLGQAGGKAWAVYFSDDTLTIDCPPHTNAFPEAEMTAQVQTAVSM